APLQVCGLVPNHLLQIAAAQRVAQRRWNQNPPANHHRNRDPRGMDNSLSLDPPQRLVTQNQPHQENSAPHRPPPQHPTPPTRPPRAAATGGGNAAPPATGSGGPLRRPPQNGAAGSYPRPRGRSSPAAGRASVTASAIHQITYRVAAFHRRRGASQSNPHH